MPLIQALWTSASRAKVHFVAVIVIGLALLLPRVADAAPRRFSVVTVWFTGNDGDRASYDEFLNCLLGRSNINDYFAGAAVVTGGGSFVVAPPVVPVDANHATDFISSLVASGALPTPDRSTTPVYLVLGTAKSFSFSACGQSSAAAIGGAPIGIALVRTAPTCWPGTTSLRNETQVGQHEIVEAVDQVLGREGCAGDGACQGDQACPSACDNFVGLKCPGAPTHSFTGCSAKPLDGWIVQKLAVDGQREEGCHRCTTCGFVPQLRGAVETPNAQLTPSAPGPPAVRSRGCTVHVSSQLTYASLASACALASALYMRRRRRR